jgi:hypothetical protein
VLRVVTCSTTDLVADRAVASGRVALMMTRAPLAAPPSDADGGGRREDDF